MQGSQIMAKQCQTEFAHQRRELLESSLINLMQEKNYQDISVKDICQEANIPRRTFYHYFDSKDDILSSFIENTVQLCFLEVMFDFQLRIDSMRDSFSKIFRFWQGESQKNWMFS